MTALRAAAVLLISFVGVLCALDLKSDTASRIREGKPLMGILSVRHLGQPVVTPPALYLAVAGTNAGSLDLVRVPPDMPVFERLQDGKHGNPRTLADAYASEDSSAPSENTMIESALTMLQSDPSWPESPSEGPESNSPSPLDFRLSFTLPANTRPGYPREMKKTLSDALLSPLFWPQFPAVNRRFSKPAAYDRLLLAREFRRLKPDRIRVSELTDPGLSTRLLARVFARANGHRETSGIIDVEVLNASQTSGLALKATRLLRLRGFDVRHFGNANAPEKLSRFLDRTGNAEGADAVAEALGCSKEEVLTSLEANPRASVSVLLGRNFADCTELASQ